MTYILDMCQNDTQHDAPPSLTIYLAICVLFTMCSYFTLLVYSLLLGMAL